MTTVVYDGYDLACESQASQGNEVSSYHVNKIFNSDSYVYAIAGDPALAIPMKESINSSLEPFKDLPDNSIGSYANEFMKLDGVNLEGAYVMSIHKESGNAVIFEGCGDGSIRVNYTFDGDYCVIGSGGSYARSALDFGCDAKEAVQYAVTKDVFSGGDIRVANIIERDEEEIDGSSQPQGF